MFQPCPKDWQGLDCSDTAKVWTQDSGGSQRRQMNRGKVVQLVAEGVNHLVGRQARVLDSFHQARNDYDENGCVELTEWTYDDNVPNATERWYHIVSIPRDNDASDNAGWITIDTTLANSDVRSTNIWQTSKANSDGPTLPRDLQYYSLPAHRGSVDAGRISETLSTYDYAAVLDVSVQEAPVSSFSDAAGHQFVTHVTQAAPGLPVLANIAEQARAKYEAWRHASLPLAGSWHATRINDAYADEAEFAALGHGEGIHREGIRVASETYVNVMDTSVTARTAHSPGIPCMGYRAGRGSSNAVPIVVGVLARVENAEESGDTNSYVALYGPVPPGSNIDGNCVFEFTSSTPEWQWSKPSTLQLNAQAADDDETISRNKLDVLARTSNAARLVIHIYGIDIRLAP